jgi:branched-chain amino acid aminotransferase
MAHPEYTWMNGRVTPWAESQVHINTDAILRGASVFEGLRAYRAAEGEEVNLFRLDDHWHRLFGTSMRFLRMEIPYGPADLVGGVREVLRANDFRADSHVRVCVYFGEVEFGGELNSVPTGVYMLAFQRPSIVDKKGIRVTLSPWRRLQDVAMSPRVKASANYLNSRTAMVDSKLKGFDWPIMLNADGRVSEGPGQNVFLVRDGILITPRTTDAILEGVTRDTVLGLARELGVRVQEREVDATELYVADELFFAGTAMEVRPIREIDHYVVGDGTIGPITDRIQEAYLAMVRGAAGRSEWLTPVFGSGVPA